MHIIIVMHIVILWRQLTVSLCQRHCGPAVGGMPHIWLLHVGLQYVTLQRRIVGDAAFAQLAPAGAADARGGSVWGHPVVCVYTVAGLCWHLCIQLLFAAHA
jgi:hypothetical protein